MLQLILAIGLLLPTQAHAYIDPIAASVNYQVLVAGGTGVAVMAWRGICSLFRRSFQTRPNKNPAGDEARAENPARPHGA